MMTPSELFNNVNEVVEVVEESIEEKQVLEEDISHSVSLIDGAFRNIQEQILNSSRKELSPYKDQVIEVYNLCKDIKENQLPRYKKEVLQSDLRTESRIKELKKELYETLEERITETEETIKVYFREEIKDVNKLRASVLAVEEYIKNSPSSLYALREEVFQELRKNTETNEELVREKLERIGVEYQNLQEGLLNDPPSTDNSDPLTPLDQEFVTLKQLQDHYNLFVNRVQQQLLSLGGGGETRLEFLDDVDRDSVKVNGKLLAWNSTVGKFIGTDTVGLSTETQTLDNVLALGGTSSRNMSVGVLTATSFSGDGSNLTGISTFSGDYNDLTNTPTIPTNNNQLTNGAGYITTSFTSTSQLTNDAGFITNNVSGVLTATSFSGDGSALTGINAGVGTTGSVNTSGIITATSFHGDGSALTGINAGVGTTGSVNTSGIITATSFHGDGSALTGISTFSGDFNDLTNAPTGIVTDSRGSSGQLLQHDGSTFVGIASTGFRDYVIDHGQGYYAYTTDYYTVGVANTTQEIEEGVWTLVMPQVASDGLYNNQPTPMQDANSGHPWIGAGATIGTGQTEFSLAGLSSGASCIVRSVFRFEPDTDETDLDMRLHFTTNTATQGTGLTNFNIEKQALVMTVGAAVTYTSETLISFFVGETLAGLTTADAGRFCIEVNGTTDGTLEVLSFTVMVDV